MTACLLGNSWKRARLALAVLLERFLNELIKLAGGGILFDPLIPKFGRIFLEPLGDLAYLGGRQLGDLGFNFFNASHDTRI